MCVAACGPFRMNGWAPHVHKNYKNYSTDVTHVQMFIRNSDDNMYTTHLCYYTVCIQKNLFLTRCLTVETQKKKN